MGISTSSSSVVPFFLTLLLVCVNVIVTFGQITETKTVDINGKGDYSSIQAAIDSVPNGNKQWILIKVKAGSYRAKVRIPADKGYIMIQGEGGGVTSIEGNDYDPNSGIDQISDDNDVTAYATVVSAASNVVFKDISIKNTYNGQHGPKVAPAMSVSGDMTSFYRCSFTGIQDTLNDKLGRHYYNQCHIEGAVDFIYGFARSMYDNCVIKTVPDLNLKVGWITANGRQSNNDPSGFVFKYCYLIGSSQTYLGRAWGKFSRVIFFQTEFPAIVDPQGWDYWRTHDKGQSTTYAEVECSGPGSDTSGRVPWERKFSRSDIADLIDTNMFISRDGWLAKQPK